MRVEMKDDRIWKAEPEGLVGYSPAPYREWGIDWPYN